ncbi:MAG: FKBP-type peptidyl-prolyl cis-trans isomerase [Candidatus Methanomethylophilus sp.]|nr:FKBP-type peptidyl-prolyl cis-trans isomerase [Methanomethylophilus sp.]MDD4222888.1 FKBP-type peptidyl-prolyl cis-trans isomerase [Methanomethylophilus sp.]
MANDAKKVIRLDYKAYMSDSNKLYDTTDEAAAKDAGIYNEKLHYAPMAYIVGSKKLFPALDKALETAAIGKEIEVAVPCEEGAGARNPKLVETYPVREFYKQQINPMPGMQVNLGNRNGTVLTVGAGRVKVDFNNPLAGHDLLYKLTVKEEITDQQEKAKAIVEADFGQADGFEFAFPAGKVAVTLPEITKFHQEWPVARFKVVSDLREAFGVDTVEFTEVWTAAKKDEAPIAGDAAPAKVEASAKKEASAKEE